MTVVRGHEAIDRGDVIVVKAIQYGRPNLNECEAAMVIKRAR
jgi:hypothetical protein